MNLEITLLELPVPIEDFYNAGITYCNDVTTDFLRQKNITNWAEIVEVPQCKTALELLNEDCGECIRIGIPQLDNLLENHFSVGSITELAGGPGSGKTQLCFYMSIYNQIVDRNLEGEVVFITTNKNFAPHRIREIAERLIMQNNLEIDAEDFLKRIHCIEVDNLDEIQAAVIFLNDLLDSLEQMKLLIIDSISFVFKKQADIGERTALLGSVLQDIRKLSLKHRFAIILTNDLTTTLEDNQKLEIPCLGDSFFHFIDTRVIVSKKDNKFNARLEKSVLKEIQEVQFEIL